MALCFPTPFNRVISKLVRNFTLLSAGMPNSVFFLVVNLRNLVIFLIDHMRMCSKSIDREHTHVCTCTIQIWHVYSMTKIFHDFYLKYAQKLTSIKISCTSVFIPYHPVIILQASLKMPDLFEHICRI